MGDSGLTGRKIIVDTYGGWGRHGGGAFSGKDPSKVDRSACYYALHRQNIVAAGLASRCEVQVAYAIGVAAPVSIHVTTFGTGRVSDESLEKLVRAHFDCRPAALIRELDLLRPIYKADGSLRTLWPQRSVFSWKKDEQSRRAQRRRQSSLRTAGQNPLPRSIPSRRDSQSGRADREGKHPWHASSRMLKSPTFPTAAS